MEHFQHLQKKDFSKIGVSYASCGPSSRQGGIWVSERGDVIPLSEVNLVHSCHASSFIIKPNKENGFTNKEEMITVSYSYAIQKREPSSHGLNVSPTNMNTIYTMRGNLA